MIPACRINTYRSHLVSIKDNRNSSIRDWRRRRREQGERREGEEVMGEDEKGERKE